MGRLSLHTFLIALFLAWAAIGHAQDDDYYAPPQKEAKPFKKEEAKKLMDKSPNRLYGPKLGIEAHAYLTYSAFVPSLPLMGFFTNYSGGVGFDGGLGLRLRVRKRFSIGLGFRYSIRQFSMEYPVIAEYPNGVQEEVQVTDEVAMFMPGLYLRPQWSLGKRIYLGPFVQFNFIGINKVTTSAISPMYGPVTPTESPIIQSYSVQLDLGIHAGYRIHVADQLIIKPGLELGLGLAPAFHTGLYTQGSRTEENAKFVNIRIGAVFEFGVWFDKAAPAQ